MLTACDVTPSTWSRSDRSWYQAQQPRLKRPPDRLGHKRNRGYTEMKNLMTLAILMAINTGAVAGNDNSNGGCHGNCSGQPSGDATATGGNATGGTAIAGGGSANAGAMAGAAAGAVSGSYSEGGSVGDIRNTANGGNVLGSGNSSSVSQGGDGGSAVALGGAGGKGGEGGTGVGFGGDAKQSQSNLGINAQSLDSKNVSGSKSIAQQALENSNKINASSANENRSSASGNTTATTVNVGGDSTLVERNAPPVFLGNLTATMSCAGGFNAGASDRNGSGALGFTFVSGDCRSVVMGREFVGIGMPDVACRIWKTTKGYKRAVKADPSLANVDCTAKPSPAAVVVPVAPELAPRIPRG
jgi:hypothetical protein